MDCMKHFENTIRLAFTYVALAATSLVMGYWFGVGSTLPITRQQDDGDAHKNELKTEESSAEDSSDSDDEVQPGEKLSEIQSSPTEECKLVRFISSLFSEQSSYANVVDRCLSFGRTLV